ncbi:MAG: TRAP transporter large permease subunit [Eubacterium sp.]|nr:TRAP transporter large permease subunit [Eubacterium sp.]
MTGGVIGIICFVVMIALVVLGVPVYLCVMGMSLVGMYLVTTPQMVLMQFTNGFFTTVANYTFSVIPLFMIVGVLAGDTGIAAGTFTSMQKWTSKRKGGLLYATVAANAVFGACSGVSSAGTIVFCKIAAPELKKRGYDESLSLGTISAAGSLSSLIPPSIGVLTFCLLTDLSIGTGLMTSFAGGLLMVLVMFVMIFFAIRITPSKVPPITDADRAVTWMDRIKTLSLLLPILLLFGLIVGGSFLGWFPPTVGGAVACVAICIYALAKKMTVKELLYSFWDGCQMFSSMYLIVMAATVFGRFIGITKMANMLIDIIANLGIAPLAVYFVIIVFYIFCGCVMDCMSVMMITVPIVFPLLTGLGFNGYAMIIVVIMISELGAITPPMGMAVFTVSTVLREPAGKIFKGVWPYIIAMLAAAIIIVIFPDIVLWLPRLMGATGV